LGPLIGDNNVFVTDTSNFQLDIPFATDSSHMKGLARTRTNINWTTYGTSDLNP
jgi:hypothetical protein